MERHEKLIEKLETENINQIKKLKEIETKKKSQKNQRQKKQMKQQLLFQKKYVCHIFQDMFFN